ncbi:Predicted lipid-binding transport protein, Tim44 family [Oceanospirillum multiglobuliferum]|uniref:Tim44-like domain-containing protein n=1 Tax=Oceanospirillum multiglobuliferum TaxID=64969 RepID=A0A1T4SFH7_9GAMM|nr:TIM44-like domain-containing protein [Oceanospirillum multiglobuliferum]OPX54254.1 hypothetical protein BTE48_15050 [Oceanospirillum multiglobuliferum]SKA27100.1 Predicted lipid-binding transport protein, Tim44 family [Oceanospirillum multiglobuliferum]
MQRVFIWFFAFFLVMGTGIDQAEAKRLGGGKTQGTFSRTAPSSPTTNQSTLTQPGKTQTAAATGGSRMKSFLGPLAGLAAGGLLAAMLFGDGFEGFQFMDFLLIALAAFIIFKLIARKRQQAAAAGMPAYQKQDHGQMQQQPSQLFNTDLMSPKSTEASQMAFQPQPQVPDWFDANSFVERAKGHFVHLQKAWDSNDLQEIQDFVTPELYNLLSAERKAQDEEPNTEVVSLNAHLGGIHEQGSLVEATVVFSGQIRENSSLPTAFSETWHLVRDMREQNANWYLQGIEQNQ